jgi:hypothetical protein
MILAALIRSGKPVASGGRLRVSAFKRAERQMDGSMNWMEGWARTWAQAWGYGRLRRVSNRASAVIGLILLILLGLPMPSFAAAIPAGRAPMADRSPGSPLRERSETIGASEPNIAQPNIAKPNIAKPSIESIPAEKIDQFVGAYQQVLALVNQRQGELQAAETETESQFRQRDIEAAAMALVEQAGLTPQEYFQLLDLASVDSELGDQIAMLLQESPDRRVPSPRVAPKRAGPAEPISGKRV